MSARSGKKALFVGMGILLLLMAAVSFLDDPDAEKNIFTNIIFIIGGISLIFFNTRK